MQFIVSFAFLLRYQQGEILEKIAHRPLRDVFRKFRLHARALVFAAYCKLTESGRGPSIVAYFS